MSGILVARTITEFEPAAWNRCFPGELEDWGYYRATEVAGIEGFELRYVAVIECGQPVAIVPAFHTSYRLDTTVQGPARRLTGRLNTLFPRLMVLRLACLGSPVAETCHLGFAPEIPDDRKGELLARLVAAFERDALAAGIRLHGVKDAAGAQQILWGAVLGRRYQRMPGLPTATLALPFADLDSYLATLGKATRKDMRRKLRATGTVRVVYRRHIDDVLDQVTELYEQTRARSDLQFEHLGPAWFTGVLDAAGERGGCFLYWVGERLAAFNLVLHDGERMIDKFIGLDGVLGRQHNLYFLSWMTNVEFCLAQGIGCYQSGQAEYGPKKRLGSRFSPNWIWFRHAGPLVNCLLTIVARLMRLDRYDPNLAAVLETRA